MHFPYAYKRLKGMAIWVHNSYFYFNLYPLENIPKYAVICYYPVSFFQIMYAKTFICVYNLHTF